MDEAEERRIWKRDAAELRRSEVYPALLRLRAAPAKECPGRGRPQGPPLPHKVGRLTPAPRPTPS